MYTYQRLNEDLSYLNYCGIEMGSIGQSVLGKDIPYVHVGDYHGAQTIITGGIHARENITSLLVMRQAFRAALKRRPFDGGIYFVPMVNPDGALLIEKGVSIAPEKAEFLLGLNGSDDFRLWKANINGVDLNNNFDAKFGQGVGQVSSPAPQGYPGEYPFDQPESAALKNFTLSVQPKLTLSYHALGQEIYWYFFQKGENKARDFAVAQRVQQALGYRLVDTDGGSTGGYKDWCVDFLQIPSLTVEIISPNHSHPLRGNELDEDWDKNKNIPYLLAEIAAGL